VVAAPVRGRSERIPIGRIFCVGRNYEAHAKEMGVAVDREAPFYFTKAAEHYAPSGSTMPYPPGTTNYPIEGVGAIRLPIGPAE
jgi:fumarylpyruvate hydrolase